jgi:hypothetical protein
MQTPGMIVLVLIVAGCTSSSPTPSPSVAASQAAAVVSSAPNRPASTPTAVPTPEPTPTTAPAASPLAADFTTPAAPASQAAWTSIAWKPIAADDPLGTVTGMVAAPGGGYVAWADPVAVTATMSASPVWASADGATWHALPGDTFGPSGVVVALGPAGGNLVALTLTGGPNSCGDQRMTPSCSTPEGPLQAWTSTDGTAWASSAGPDVPLPEGCDTCGVNLPEVAFGAPGVLVITNPVSGIEGEPAQESTHTSLATSMDGTSWIAVPASALPPSFQVGRIAGYADAFLAAGDNGKDPGHAEVAISTDGATWTTSLLTGQGHPAEGSTGQALLVGEKGVLVDGSTQDVPGQELEWSSPDGTTWQFVSGYPPLGVWIGEGEGSGLIPHGSMAADGNRLLALRTDGKVESWTSSDGATWTSIPSTGLTARAKDSWPTFDLLMLPVGVVMTEESGARWLGVAAQGG